MWLMALHFDWHNQLTSPANSPHCGLFYIALCILDCILQTGKDQTKKQELVSTTLTATAEM